YGRVGGILRDERDLARQLVGQGVPLWRGIAGWGEKSEYLRSTGSGVVPRRHRWGDIRLEGGGVNGVETNEGIIA
ncbi:MAG: hypothetical protein VX317_00475, partial [Verrucomicrobiota bacterium]|nr:hypothetical protein [Verrucomicrobiota bacterium]